MTTFLSFCRFWSSFLDLFLLSRFFSISKKKILMRPKHQVCHFPIIMIFHEFSFIVMPCCDVETNQQLDSSTAAGLLFMFTLCRQKRPSFRKQAYSVKSCVYWASYLCASMVVQRVFLWKQLHTVV